MLRRDQKKSKSKTMCIYWLKTFSSTHKLKSLLRPSQSLPRIQSAKLSVASSSITSGLSLASMSRETPQAPKGLRHKSKKTTINCSQHMHIKLSMLARIKTCARLINCSSFDLLAATKSKVTQDYRLAEIITLISTSRIHIDVASTDAQTWATSWPREAS